MGLFDIIKKKLFGEKKKEEIPKKEVREEKPQEIKEIKEERIEKPKEKKLTGKLPEIKKEARAREKSIKKKTEKKEKVKERVAPEKKTEETKEVLWEEKLERPKETIKEKIPEGKKEEPKEEVIQVEKAVEAAEETKEVVEEEKLEETIREKIKDKIIAKEVTEIKREERAQEKLVEKTSKEIKPKRGLFQTISTLFTHSAKQALEQVVSRVTDKVIDEETFSGLFKDFELFLLEANVAFDVIDEFRERLKMRLLGKKVNRKQLEESVKETLRDELLVCFRTGDNRAIEQLVKESQKPFVILMVGINGSGKTTTIAKLAQRFLKNKLSVVFGAADTFRAAAQEQLEVHADRLKIPVIKQNYGADPAAVAFDAIAHAKAKGVDVVLIDSAGRLNTNENLIRELEKIKRVAKPNLTILVSEALSGADVLEQARVFCERVGIDFNIVTKLDATTKWGGLVSIAHQTKKPIMFVGKGQEYEDLEVFEKGKFIDELLGGI